MFLEKWRIIINLQNDQDVKYLLCRSVGAHDVFHIIGVRIVKSETVCSQANPVTILRPKTIHNRHDLTFEVEHCKTNVENAEKKNHSVGHTVLETLLHMILILGMIIVETSFSQQFRWLITKNVRYTWIDECEFSVKRVA